MTSDRELHHPALLCQVLEPGGRYLMEVVVRTTGMGHALTQGTADSNEVWLELTLRAGDRVLARSGALGADGAVDDWAWFGNAYLPDRDGHRIDRRNAQDIVVALYDHQAPPGAAAVVHYAFEVPADLAGDLATPLRIEAALRYRKFDTRFYRHVRGDAFTVNDLPIVTLAEDRLTLPIGDAAVSTQDRGLADWERWNDYGIGLLREGKRGESRQAEDAFRQVEALGRADGPMNLARLLAAADDLALRDPPRALRIAADLALQQPIPPHQRLLALAQAASGRFDDAIETARRLLAMPDWMLLAPARDQAREQTRHALEAYTDGELPRPAWPVDDPLLSPPPFDAARVLRDYP